MKFIQILIENKKVFFIASLLLAFVLATVFTSFSSGINKSTRNYLNGFLTSSPDSNIVIIEITENDINQLGWPLKRNYYALLINKLNSLGAKAIGLEVYLSPDFSAQSIYNDLLIDVIKKKKNVVLGSIARNLNESDGNREVEILLPAPKEKDTTLISGHLNYFAYDELTIPLIISSNKKMEPSFSWALFKLFNNEEIDRKEIQLNIKHNFDDFTKISLIKFLKGEKAGNLFLKDKVVLIGVTAPSLAKYVDVGIAEKISGISVHAFALENLINKDYLITDYKLVFTLITLLLFAFIILKEKTNKLWLAFILLFILYSAVYTFANISVDFAFLVLAFFLIESSSKIIELIESKTKIASFTQEKEILQRRLAEKESELNNLRQEFINKQKEVDEKLKERIENLQKEINDLRAYKLDEERTEIDSSESKNFEGIIYSSAKMQEVVNLISKVATSDATVLIYGESGSGKELVAKALHNLSNRKGKNFVAVNCAALTESLLESELFGYVKGAFTNALADKKGLFEAANDGTIFLDEIGEVSPAFQSKLLRVLQNGEYHKVGSTEASYTNARIISATNKDLEKLVKEKKFREDLYYRLNVISIHLPPLRERKEDIPVLANYFLKKESEKLNISKAVLTQLEKYDWRGNIRELESIIKRAAIFALSENRELVHLRDLPDELRSGIKDSIEELILDSLRKKKFSHSSINETASELGGISRTIISENLRGVFFRYYVKNNFDHIAAVTQLSATEDEEVNNRLISKTGTYLKNVKKDVEKYSGKSFAEIKTALNSKYKNLPQRYHRYLDEIIKHFISEK